MTASIGLLPMRYKYLPGYTSTYAMLLLGLHTLHSSHDGLFIVALQVLESAEPYLGLDAASCWNLPLWDLLRSTYIARSIVYATHCRE